MKISPLRLGMATLLTVAASICAYGVQPDESTRQLASNYYAYPYPAAPAPALTPAPTGYTPFHIEHYGRHGSRWHIGKDVYKRPIRLLEPAERNGMLTDRGRELMAELRRIELASQGRDGELTPVGADQHRGIARRMYANFPEVFADSARVDARSTVVIRCILSMDNELQELKAANPALRVTSDASHADMYYMNFSDVDTVAHNAAKRGWHAVQDFAATVPSHNDFIAHLVTDTAWAADSLDLPRLFSSLFDIAANAQSHYDQTAPYDIFSERELYDRWRVNNASWFGQYGNSAHSGNMAMASQRNLLRNIIASADTAILNGNPTANLRFGHEVVVMPLVVLMELDHYGDQIDDYSQLEEKWKNYEIFPMASNVQIIFYRPESAAAGSFGNEDVLVKVLLNEREMHLPVAESASGFPYYRYTDLRQHYLDRLSTMP